MTNDKKLSQKLLLSTKWMARYYLYVWSVLSTWKHIWSYILGIKLQEFESEVSGKLELWLINGKKVLNSANANYSFDSLHRVFQLSFAEKKLELKPQSAVLVLGFGCGSVAHILQKEYGFDCYITGVDLDPLMFELAEKHFDIKASNKLKFVVADAEKFMEENQEKFDLIVVDLFVDDVVPEKFSSKEFIDSIVNSMNEKGQLFMNTMESNAVGKAQSQRVQDMLKNEEVLYPEKGNAVIYYAK